MGKDDVTPLDAHTIARLKKHYEEQAALLKITPERAMYDSCRNMGIKDYNVDKRYGFPIGTTAGWVKINNLPPLDGSAISKTAEEILKPPTRMK